MFEVTILGFQYIDFQPQNGERINGYKVWFSRQPENQHIQGKTCSSTWVSCDRWNKFPLSVGLTCAACYNDKGKVGQFLPADILDFGL